MKVAGITARRRIPQSGMIEQHADGEPNGIVRERNFICTASWFRGTRGAAGTFECPTPEEAQVVLRRWASRASTSSATRAVSMTRRRARRHRQNRARLYPTFKVLFRKIVSARWMTICRARPSMHTRYPGAERTGSCIHINTGQGDDQSSRSDSIGESTGCRRRLHSAPAPGLDAAPADYKGQPGFRGKASLHRSCTAGDGG